MSRRKKAKRATQETAAPDPDEMLDRILAFDRAAGGGVLVAWRSRGFTLIRECDGRPIARLRVLGEGDLVEVRWWDVDGRWRQIGDFGPMTMPLDEALEYVATDPMGIFGL